MVIRAKRPNMPVTSFTKRVNSVGTRIIGGGTRINDAGIPTGIGTTTTTGIGITRIMTIAKRLASDPVT